jgi:hypothetical protein
MVYIPILYIIEKPKTHFSDFISIILKKKNIYIFDIKNNIYAMQIERFERKNSLGYLEFIFLSILKKK